MTTLDSSTDLSDASENGFSLDATAHGQSKLGSRTSISIVLTSSGQTINETFHTSCSCRANPEVNLVVGNAMCLDSGSVDNTASLVCTNPGTPDSCCSGFDAGTCGGADVCTATNAPLFCCSGAGAYSACKGAESPLFKLTRLHDPSLGIVDSSGGGNNGSCTGTLPDTGCANVTYTYTLLNNGTATATNIQCTDNLLGSLGTIPDLAIGASTTVTKTASVCGSTTNLVDCTVNGVGPTDPSDCHASAAILAPCQLGWPTPGFNAPDCPLGPVRGPTPFAENSALKAVRPTGVSTNPTSVNLFYGDEHALTLGASKVGNTTCTVEPTPSAPACVNNPAIGCVDATDPANRPIWPALFITDITTDFQSRAGDWQCGGTAQQPTEVCGLWKPFTAGTRLADPRTANCNHEGDKKKNNGTCDDGMGSDPYPPLPDATCTCVGSFHCNCGGEKFGAEVKWDLSGLVDNHGSSLQAGHTYRIQVMAHDGDQNQAGGDVGQQCVNVFITE